MGVVIRGKLLIEPPPSVVILSNAFVSFSACAGRWALYDSVEAFPQLLGAPLRCRGPASRGTEQNLEELYPRPPSYRRLAHSVDWVSP